MDAAVNQIRLRSESARPTAFSYQLLSALVPDDHTVHGHHLGADHGYFLVGLGTAVEDSGCLELDVLTEDNAV